MRAPATLNVVPFHQKITKKENIMKSMPHDDWMIEKSFQGVWSTKNLLAFPVQTKV